MRCESTCFNFSAQFVKVRTFLKSVWYTAVPFRMSGTCFFGGKAHIFTDFAKLILGKKKDAWFWCGKRFKYGSRRRTYVSSPSLFGPTWKISVRFFVTSWSKSEYVITCLDRIRISIPKPEYGYGLHSAESLYPDLRLSDLTTAVLAL